MLYLRSCKEIKTGSAQRLLVSKCYLILASVIGIIATLGACLDMCTWSLFVLDAGC